MSARTLARLIGGALAGVLIAACAARSTAGQRPVARPASALARNRAQTQLETRRLVALAPLPPGHVALSRPAGSVPGPGAPVTSSLVDTTVLWRVSMSVSAALTWARAHPPTGLTQQGSSSSSSSGTLTSAGLSYGAPDSSHWTGAQLDVTLSPAGPGTTDWRVDGMAEWLDPLPQPDTRTGTRIHVSRTSGCPRTDRGVIGVTNSGADLDQALLPTARPTGAILCRYEGLNGHPFRLRPAHPLSPAQARRLAETVRNISLVHVDGGVYACGAADGSATVIGFTYPSRTVDLWYRGSGCPSVANGVIRVDGAGGSIGPLVGAIRQLVK